MKALTVISDRCSMPADQLPKMCLLLSIGLLRQRQQTSALVWLQKGLQHATTVFSNAPAAKAKILSENTAPQRNNAKNSLSSNNLSEESLCHTLLAACKAWAEDSEMNSESILESVRECVALAGPRISHWHTCGLPWAGSQVAYIYIYVFRVILNANLSFTYDSGSIMRAL
jgi:hypothetical protein